MSKLVFASLITALLILAGCSSDKSVNPYEIKNPELKSEIVMLQQEMIARNLTENDTIRLLDLAQDPIESFYVKEFAWLVKHAMPEHYNHPLTFLDWYIKTGDDNFCAPHEIGHIYAYLEFNDTAYAEQQFAVAKGKVGLWAERQDANKKKFPQYYPGLDELKGLIQKAISLLEQKDYSKDTIQLLKEIDTKSIC